MRNQGLWQPSKFEQAAGRWRASRDVNLVKPGSRLIGDLLAPAYARLLRDHARGRLLDIGCGRVPLYGMYQAAASEIVCVDRPEVRHGREFIDVFGDLGEGLGFADAHFDTIVCTDVLEHIWNAEAAWRELARLLAPGGRLIVGVPFLYRIHLAPHDHHRYTEFALRRYCESAGLAPLELRAVGGYPQVLADLLLKGVATRPVWRTLFGELILRLGRRLRSHDNRYPLAYTLVAERPAAAKGAESTDA